MTLARTITSVALMAALIGCAEDTSSESFELNENIERVVVNVDLGDLTISAGSMQDVTLVNVAVDCRTVAADYDVYVDGDTLHVEMNAGIDSSACEGAFEIIVPADVDVTARTARGNVAVTGIDGDVSAVTYDGNIELTDVAGDLDISAVSGNVTGIELESMDNTISLGAGDAALAFTRAPHLVDVDTIMGNVNLTVPETTYHIDAVTDSGLVDVDGVNNLATADSELLLIVESGDILIRGVE
ncbi:MAG: hypothetical protein GY854_06655 [Deltaproteobacteria bacterium]|nr:hypothetical protein [Deltaproteobacteria bacterium]